jgi:MoaA/NifB/PqqE/SkfB family radical SAM enzyme
MLKRILNHVTNRIHTLPVLVLMPHSRCNCRCVMCDIWKANHEKREITVEELESHLLSFARLEVKRVALSGGEALLHSNLWKLCEKLRSIGIKISLLSTGLTVRQHAAEIVANCDDLIVSLDGSKNIHNSIRNLPAAFEKLEEGVREVKGTNRSFRVTGRCVIQKQNFRDIWNILRTAKALNLDQISFLGADVSSGAFNRPEAWPTERTATVALDLKEIEELHQILNDGITEYKADFDSGFIAESPEKLMSIVQHYKAVAGLADFPERKCNAPWVSAVIESNGDVMPCFFHKPYGNIREKGLSEVLNSSKAVAFRQTLKVGQDPTCRRCVCSLHVPLIGSN